MFKVTALPFDGTPRAEDGKVNYKEDFFGNQSYRIWTIGRWKLSLWWVRFIHLGQRLEQRILILLVLLNFG
jgi:hypothetical protein